MNQSMNILKSVSICKQISKPFSSEAQKTHYDVLGIGKTASKKEIRSAFITLSKKTHPDTSGKEGDKSHKDFIKVTEAYNVLSNESTRNNYDMSLKYDNQFMRSQYQSAYSNNYYYQQQRAKVYRSRDGRDWHQYENDFYSQKNYHNNYYYDEAVHQEFIKMRRTVNTVSLAICFIILTFGIFLHYFTATASITFKRDKLIEMSKRNENLYSNARTSALKFIDKSPDQQFRLMYEDYLKSKATDKV